METNTAYKLRKTRRGSESSERVPILVSKKSAAALLSLCVRTIDNLITRKELPARRVGKRVLIPYSALIAFANRDHATRRTATTTTTGPGQVQ